MYTPKIYNAPSAAAMKELIINYSFGLIITPDLVTTHIPVELEKKVDGPS